MYSVLLDYFSGLFLLLEKRCEFREVLQRKIKVYTRHVQSVHVAFQYVKLICTRYLNKHTKCFDFFFNYFFFLHRIFVEIFFQLLVLSCLMFFFMIITMFQGLEAVKGVAGLERHL